MQSFQMSVANSTTEMQNQVHASLHISGNYNALKRVSSDSSAVKK